MHYEIDPGLYALGRPEESSPVLVTANYKMSFDRLRAALPGRDAWILVLDTKGVNVWCAAGKGSFGTAELVSRIKSTEVFKLVAHRRLILPQLAAPGVSAHLVSRRSSFKVAYGPIRAEDLPAFLDAGMKATPEMRRKTFPLSERAALIPVELVAALKAALFTLPVILLLSCFGGTAGLRTNLSHFGVFSVVAVLSAILAGAVLTPLALPWLPGRAFSFKGLITGVLMFLVLAAFRSFSSTGAGGMLELGAWALLVPAFSAYLAMNFTGASTYTSLSGVKKEMRRAVPLQIGACAAGVILLIASRLMN